MNLVIILARGRKKAGCTLLNGENQGCRLVSQHAAPLLRLEGILVHTYMYFCSSTGLFWPIVYSMSRPVPGGSTQSTRCSTDPQGRRWFSWERIPRILVLVGRSKLHAWLVKFVLFLPSSMMPIQFLGTETSEISATATEGVSRGGVSQSSMPTRRAGRLTSHVMGDTPYHGASSYPFQQW